MQLSKDIKGKIKNDALNSIKRRNLVGGVNLYLHVEEFAADQKFNAGPKEIRTPRRTALVFADLAPQFNWGHPCQHMLYDADTREMYEIVEAEFPPAEFFTHHEKFEAIATPVKPIDAVGERKLKAGPIPAITNALTNATGNRYAILFSGMSNNRHVNDMEFLYRTLIDIYGFNAANIQVLNHNGTIDYFGSPHPVGNWPGDNTPYRMVVNGSGTNTALANAISSLAPVLQEDDFLFIHTNNHGDGPPRRTQSCLCCYGDPNWIPYNASDFAAELAALPEFAVLMVMMEQCHSGGFMTPIINNSPAKWAHFAAACREDRGSIGGANFDPFAYDWIAAVTGQYADGSALSQAVDVNHDGRISAVEAFNYADAVKDPYDTPVSADSPVGYGNYIFLGLPAHDLFIRDNLEDYGREPLIGGGISLSPDVIIFNQELLDPQGTLGSSAAQDMDDLGEMVEYGQDNFIYLRIQNRGTNPTSGSAKVYWSPVSTFPTPSSWNLIDEITIPEVAPDEFKVVGHVKWARDDIPEPGHYCFIALIGSGDDPAPDPSTILSYDDFYHSIRESNNASWKNFDVVNMFEGTRNELTFHIQGWPRTSIHSDLRVDLKELSSEAQVTLRILKRLTNEATLEGLELVEESTLYRRYTIASGRVSFLRNMNLKSSDDCQATLEFVLPDSIADGAYRISVSQLVDDLEMGRITQMIAVGEYPFVANRGTGELHLRNCRWVNKMNRSNMVAYGTLERALKHKYNGCHYCLPEHDTG
ncbi:MAG: caspase family protein [Proteobacteria bacterium]|nr:caspase family protein [Pseudomonadota bacterium]